MIFDSTARRALAAALVLCAAPITGAASALPKIQGKPSVASVNGDPITLAEYLDELGALHSEVQEAGPMVPKRDPSELLHRLVNLRLILQEAEKIGLDELPELKAAMAETTRGAVRSAVLARAGGSVSPPTPAEIEKAYHDKVLELGTASVRFATRDEAAAFLETVRAGSEFMDTGARFVLDKKAEAIEEPTHTRREEMIPTVVQALDALEPGGSTDPIPLGDKFLVIQLIDRRVPDDPAAREEAKREAAAIKRRDAVRKYVDGMVERLVRQQPELIQSLDFDANPKILDTLLEDDRVLAQIRGGNAIRVRDLAEALRKRFFHGVDQAALGKRLNKAKLNVMLELVTEGAIQQEGKNLGLDRTPDVLAALKAIRAETLFGLFVQKVIEPSIHIKDESVEAYYQSHLAQLTSPEMIRLESLAFVDDASAQHALERLRAGADLGWMRENAEGRADPSQVPEELRFEGRLVLLTSIPAGAQKALEGASKNDFRVFREDSGRSHALAVRDRVPARPAPLDEVRQEVARRVYDESRNRAVEEWSAKLWQASKIEIFADSEQLRALAMESR